MTNAELIEELERARDALADAERIFLVADNAGVLTVEIERAYMEADEDVRQLSNEVEHRLNWESRPRAWR